MKAHFFFELHIIKRLLSYVTAGFIFLLTPNVVNADLLWAADYYGTTYEEEYTLYLLDINDFGNPPDSDYTQIFYGILDNKYDGVNVIPGYNAGGPNTLYSYESSTSDVDATLYDEMGIPTISITPDGVSGNYTLTGDFTYPVYYDTGGGYLNFNGLMGCSIGVGCYLEVYDLIDGILPYNTEGFEEGQIPGEVEFMQITDFVVVASTPVPVPAAVWLFGSGLLGLVGMARRKKT